MPDDPLEAVLRLVAEGRLTVEEATPVLDALDARARADQPMAGPSTGSATSPGGGHGRAIRLEVTDKGRTVVNLRVPLSLGRAALDRVPGLSEATTQRIREAIEGGVTGPILQVDDAGDGVRVVVE